MGETTSLTLANFISQFGNLDVPKQIYTSVQSDVERTGVFIDLWKLDSRTTTVLDFYFTDDLLRLSELYSTAVLEKGEGANVTSSPAYGDEFYMELFDYYLLRNILRLM